MECVVALPTDNDKLSCPQCRQSVRAISNPNRSLIAALEDNARRDAAEARAEAAALRKRIGTQILICAGVVLTAYLFQYFGVINVTVGSAPDGTQDNATSD